MRIFRIIFLILPICFTCCKKIGKSNTIIHTAKYSYFDLFTMQGVEPCDNDSSVTVSYMGDSLKIEYSLPEKYTLTLHNKGDYWYSHREFDMDKDRYNLTISEYGAPRIYDRFIKNDTIFEYCQILSEAEVYKYIYIKTRELYTLYDLAPEYDTDTNISMIYDRILSVLNGDSYSNSAILVWEVKRRPQGIQFIDRDSGDEFFSVYPCEEEYGLGYYIEDLIN